MLVKDEIYEWLFVVFDLCELMVVDDSESYRGYVGY